MCKKNVVLGRRPEIKNMHKIRCSAPHFFNYRSSQKGADLVAKIAKLMFWAATEASSDTISHTGRPETKGSHRSKS